MDDRQERTLAEKLREVPVVLTVVQWASVYYALASLCVKDAAQGDSDVATYAAHAAVELSLRGVRAPAPPSGWLGDDPTLGPFLAKAAASYAAVLHTRRQ